MEHFRIASANRHQFDYENSYSLSAVNAIALAKDIPWEDSYRRLLKQAHWYGLMPADVRCVRNMLIEAGYTKAKDFRRVESYGELSRFLMERYPNVSSGLAITAIAGTRSKRVCALRRLGEASEGFTALDTRWQDRTIIQVWLPYDEIGEEKPAIAPLYTVDKSRPEPDHDGYRYFQPNPRNNSIGDCVIRGYAAVFDVSWDEALDMIAKSNEYRTTTVNSGTTYRYLTSEYGFVYHDRLTRGGEPLSGVEFCAQMTASCRHGERIFADVGRCHVAGIVPVDTPGGKQYVIKDSWDSTYRKIGKYFVYTPPEKTPEPSGPVRLAEGARLSHPHFGVGTVASVEGERVVIDFEKAGKKTFSLSWITANCKDA